MEPQYPVFSLGQHDSTREGPLSDLQYGHLLTQGFNFVTTPITNHHFQARIYALVSNHLKSLEGNEEAATTVKTSTQPDPIILPITPEDTALYPSVAVGTYVGYVSPWIELCSANPLIANISRQVLNLEVNYANFCGVKTLIVPEPRANHGTQGSQGLAQYARAILEALNIGNQTNILIHMPLLYELRPRDTASQSLSSLDPSATSTSHQVDSFTAWDSWHYIRTVCSYNVRLSLALKLPKAVAEKDLQNRWFAEPLTYITFDSEAFKTNKGGFPCLSKQHQGLIFSYMRLKSPPCILLCDIGPDVSSIRGETLPILANASNLSNDHDFPPLSEAQDVTPTPRVYNAARCDHVDYLKWLESEQPPFSALETPVLTSFQDWLQSPLQPLSDNLESATYEVFEGDPVKYNQYEIATMEALIEWKKLGKPTSRDGVVVIAVAGSGRGPLVTRALKAAEYADMPVEIWAVEKNPSAYVYLLRQNQCVWGGRVNVVKTDMRHWRGPVISASADSGVVHGKVDILISELLGSFGDNELSPECLDGIQHVIAEHGISIPSFYTAHLSPISTPKIHADILMRSAHEPTAFDTPWVVRLFALDFVAQKVPKHRRIQEAWEFSHPIPAPTLATIEARRSGGVVGGGGGSMAGAAGANDHNSRFCHLTFTCRSRGVTHGLAGYFEATLYESQLKESFGEKVEISIHPERIDAKSKDMISWFPIFFPLKQPLYFPADSELEVSMWRQTDDTKVWYEWIVEAWTWTGPSTRIKVATSELCSSRQVACIM